MLLQRSYNSSTCRGVLDLYMLNMNEICAFNSTTCQLNAHRRTDAIVRRGKTVFVNLCLLFMN